MLGIPTHLAPRVSAWSLIRAFHTGAVAALVLAIAVLLVCGAWIPGIHVVAPILALICSLGAAAAHIRWSTRWTAGLFLLVGGVGSGWVAFAIQRDLAMLGYVGSFLVSLAIIPLILVGGEQAGAARVIGWSLLGFAVGRAATIIGAALAGGAYRPAVLSVIALGFVVGMIAAGTRRSRRAQLVQPELLLAARDEQMWQVRQEIEMEAAAIVHDTVLNHLSAIALAPPGTLDPELARMLRDDVAMLDRREWLRHAWEPEPTPDSHPFLTMIESSRSADLAITVSGDLAVLGTLEPEVTAALTGAVGQCLANVRKHAATNQAEVSVFVDGQRCTVMVVDDGRGFDERTTREDRLGLRTSVRQRIARVGGEVRIWSAPGSGTSIMLTVPRSAQEAVGALGGSQ
ncbi:sensor histidine kinase [Curtobacterium ammoniigenes]|uniref:sensor histidine kinase n=1 Tax=Curtobacterium ammoniigenes TaxID=395387 RepID=UPI0008295D45|nr:ATP-binding protein [Curtobacterium ammoniigenes]